MNYKKIAAGVLACTMVMGATNFNGIAGMTAMMSFAEDSASTPKNDEYEEPDLSQPKEEEENDSIEDETYDDMSEFAYTTGEIDGFKSRKYNDHITIYEYDKTLKNKECVIPETIEDLPVKAIAYKAFDGAKCSSVIIPDTVEVIESMAFKGCQDIISIKFPANLKTIGSQAFVLTHLRTVELPEGLETIGDSAFLDCKLITELNIPSTVTRIGESAFKNCYKITSISIPGGVKKIPKTAFANCMYMTEVTLGEGIQTINSMAFSGCKRIESINFPDSLISIGYSAFEDCAAIKSVVLGDNVYTIKDQAFQNCKGITELKLSKNLASIQCHVFNKCTSLTEVVIPVSTTILNVGAFSKCASLEKITIENPACKMSYKNYGHAISNSTKSIDPVFSGTIYGYTDSSTAAKYAKKWGFKYVNLGDNAPEYVEPTEGATDPDMTYPLGDANCDGAVTMADAAAILQFLGNADRFPLSKEAYKNADCCNPGDGVSARDAIAIQKFLGNIIESLPEVDKK